MVLPTLSHRPIFSVLEATNIRHMPTTDNTLTDSRLTSAFAFVHQNTDQHLHSNIVHFQHRIIVVVMDPSLCEHLEVIAAAKILEAMRGSVHLNFMYPFKTMKLTPDFLHHMMEDGRRVGGMLAPNKESSSSAPQQSQTPLILTLPCFRGFILTFV